MHIDQFIAISLTECTYHTHVVYVCVKAQCDFIQHHPHCYYKYFIVLYCVCHFTMCVILCGPTCSQEAPTSCINATLLYLSHRHITAQFMHIYYSCSCEVLYYYIHTCSYIQCIYTHNYPLLPPPPPHSNLPFSIILYSYCYCPIPTSTSNCN